VDIIKNREIHLVVNTPAGKLSKFDDSYIRKEAIRYKIPYIATLAGALAAARGIASARQNSTGCASSRGAPCPNQIIEDEARGMIWFPLKIFLQIKYF
jgi:hypothetical protein